MRILQNFHNLYRSYNYNHFLFTLLLLRNQYLRILRGCISEIGVLASYFSSASSDG